jgi:type IX secretion system PorP/SprF family membrane protein
LHNKQNILILVAEKILKLSQMFFQMKKILLGISAAMVLVGTVQAQDLHFTQYFASPLTLNPALTGLTPCDLRVSANYRSQWASVSNNPYTSASISFDLATLKGKLNNGDALGIGVLALYDRAGMGALTNINFGLSVAYHKALGAEKRHNISLGVQGVLVQKSIDFSKVAFEDQFDPSTGGVIGNTSEAVGNNDLNYPDFNAGLMYSGRVSDHATAYAGYSIYHLTQPVETFLKNGGGRKIHARSTAYLGGSFDLNENVVLYASGLYQEQAAASEVVLGAAVGFVLNPGYDPEFQKGTVLYLGGWYRYGDAVAPYIGLEWSKWKLGVSYDVNVSSFTPATNGNGAYELSLIFNGCINKREKAPQYNFACPKF